MGLRLACVAAASLLIVASCVGPQAPATSPVAGLTRDRAESPTSAPTPIPSASEIATPETTSSSPFIVPWDDAHHGAPEMERLLPPTVGGRPLAIWSMAGRPWLEFGLGERAADFIAICESEGVDLGEFRTAIAGRVDVSKDPPYFVYAYYKPVDQDANLALLQFAGGAAGFLDPSWYEDATAFDAVTVSGKEVLLGTEGMLKQDEHQQGRPYVYETDEYLFIVISSEAAWAEDALTQLP
jgi:hypothetical protein